VYIERRLTPLNLYLANADDAARIRAMRDYGEALRELAAVNIFPGDLLFKNFGVTRYGRVVFYDYDEIDYLSDCNFRDIPSPPPEWDEMSSDIWYSVGPRDIFPEEFETFLLTDPRVRNAFIAFHADLLRASAWQSMQRGIVDGALTEVLSYPRSIRFHPPSTNDLATAPVAPAG
jgi:isocitrate dehydrogenase kinase/phosphatase